MKGEPAWAVFFHPSSLIPHPFRRVRGSILALDLELKLVRHSGLDHPHVRTVRAPLRRDIFHHRRVVIEGGATELARGLPLHVALDLGVGILCRSRTTLHLRRRRDLFLRGDRDLVRANHCLTVEFAVNDVHGRGRPAFQSQSDLALPDRLAVERYRALDGRVALLFTLLTADYHCEDEEQEKSET